MERTHHVFITVKGEELAEMVHSHLKRKGFLKNLPSSADYSIFDDGGEVCLEYIWEE